MAIKELDRDDPMDLSVAPVADPTDGVLREIAQCVAEEYLLMGWPRDAVVAFFSSPFYRVPHQAYLRFGPVGVLQIVNSAAAELSKRRVR